MQCVAYIDNGQAIVRWPQGISIEEILAQLPKSTAYELIDSEAAFGWLTERQFALGIVPVVEDTPDPTPEEELAALQKAFTDAIQARLDSFAQTRGYDGIVSACTYATDPHPVFAAEGQYAVEARSATWAAAYAILGAVLAGERPMPTLDEVFTELPRLAWPER
jgi:hypothetical protein